ncbi:hypothetical protein PM082_011132 [Marasmius tenuissimus]|nr:hypothetical protein PM082_011132 [Marasmius tenuissimus]
MSTTVEKKSITSLRSLLNQFLRISIADGRILLGSFLGTDQALNLLLMNTEEFRLLKVDGRTAQSTLLSDWDGRLSEGMELENPSGRYIGQIVVPWKHIVKIEVHGREDRTAMAYRDGLYI